MLEKRPKLLFLAYPFPPLRGTACVRTWNIAKFLSRLGWEVTVVTPHPSLWRTVDAWDETDFALAQEGISRILTGHRWPWLIPDQLKCSKNGLGWVFGGICRRISRRLGIKEEVGWIKETKKACSTLTPQDVDLILATGPPFTPFKLAKHLSEKLRCPYVLDYRDPWTGGPHATRPARTAAIQEEARLLAGCAAATIVSPSWGLAMEPRFGLGSKLHVVTNGYDPEELASVEPYDFGHFSIVYTGTFIPPKRVISPLMAALKKLKDAMSNRDGVWYFHYYGAHENHVREEARRFGVLEQVVLHGNIRRPEVLSRVRGASVAVVITSIDSEITLEDKGIVPAKVFEALGLQTPVLLITTSGSDAEAITEAVGLTRSFTGSDVDGMASFLKDVMQGRFPAAKDSATYEWPNIVRKLDVVLRTAIESSSPKMEGNDASNLLNGGRRSSQHLRIGR